MASFLNELSYFILPYLSDDGKFIECITESNNYNMELIEKDRDRILEFIFKHFNIRKGFIRIDELLCGRDYRLWNYLRTMRELDVLDKLVGLLIAVGILEDSCLTRIESFCEMKSYGEFLIRENFCLFDEETIANYLLTIRDYVLHLYRFNVNEDIFEYMTKFANTDQNKDIKEKLIAWIKTSKIAASERDLEVINGFLNNNLEQFINAIVTGFDFDQGPEMLVNYLKFDPDFCYMGEINNLISRYNYNQREDLENKKKLFFDFIEETLKKRKLQ